MRNSISFIYYHILLFSGTWLMIKCTKETLPTISVLDVESADNFKFTSVSDMGDIYTNEFYSISENDLTVSQNIIAITLKCSASYPVYWTFDNAEEIDLQTLYDTFIVTGRNGSVEQDPKDWQYFANIKFWTLTLELTRNYTCEAHHDKSLQTSIFMFSPGSALYYLVQAGKHFNISVGSKSTITLPCGICTIDVEVKLFKEEIEIGEPFNVSVWKQLPVNDSIRYNPRKGFTLTVRDLPQIFGYFRCNADEQNEDDVVHFQILPTSEEIDKEEKLQPRIFTTGSAVIQYNYTTESIMCCSNSDKPPVIQGINCNNPLDCDLALRRLALSNENDGTYYGFYQGMSSDLSKNCSSKFLNSPIFVVKCKGDGIDVLSQYYYSFNDSFKMESVHDYRVPRGSFEVIPTSTKVSWDKLILFQLTNFNYHHQDAMLSEDGSYYINETNSVDNKMFSGQTYLFKCFYSPYLFGNGVFFKVTWKDKTTKKFREPDLERQLTMYFERGSGIVSITVDENMTSITCNPPVWNSTEWAKKKLDLEIKVPTFYVKDNSEFSEIYWTLNDTDRMLECSFSGEPTPEISWEKDGKELFSNEMYSISRMKDKSILKFLKAVSHDAHGEYSCFGHNFAYNANQIFLVVIQENDSTHVFVTTGAILIILIICGALGMIAYKTQLHQKILRNMREATFQT